MGELEGGMTSVSAQCCAQLSWMMTIGRSQSRAMGRDFWRDMSCWSYHSTPWTDSLYANIRYMNPLHW